MSLIHDPALLIRDEPMSGLDPLGRLCVKQLMTDLRTKGKTILFSTHILPDVSDIADRYAILHNGTIIDTGKPKSVDIEKRFAELVQSEIII